MPCYRIYLHGRAADFHQVILGIESQAGSVVIEREDTPVPADDTPVRPRRIELFLPVIDGLVRLGDHHCTLAASYEEAGRALLGDDT